MLIQPIPEEVASDLFQRSTGAALPSPPRDFLSRGAPEQHLPSAREGTLTEAVYRRVDEFMPYLVAALFFGLQWVFSQLTTGGVNLILMSAAVLVEAGLILRWSRKRYGR